LIIAIDAPLAFPRAFRGLINGTISDIPVTGAEIENTLAYRSCERRVAERYGKKPLSAPFDKLGNNATLAIAVANKLSKDGFHVVPQEAVASERSVIEVYPALAKTGLDSATPAIPALHHFLPSSVRVGTDQYDAAICALLGILYGGGGPALGLPTLENFADDFPDLDEGWIFSLPPDFVDGGRSTAS
jgi:predicted nuclease with RNAse H fold